VVTAFDIDVVKRGEQLLVEARTYAESIVDTVRECLVVLDPQLRVLSANRAFHQTFRVTPQQIAGTKLVELGQGEWNLPSLKKNLDELAEGHAFEGLRVEQDFGPVGRRAFVLNARRIEHTSFVLLALEDVTEKEHAETALQRTEIGFRDMLMTAAEAVFMSDPSGKIVFANQAAGKSFGYAETELLGMTIEALVPEPLRSAHVQHRAEFMAAPSPRPMGGDRPLAGRRKDGTAFPLEIVLGSMTTAAGPLAVSFVTDISRRRETEKKIRDYQDKLQHMAFEAAVAEERERRRIAVDLHDRIGQSLALAQIKLSSVREAVTGAPRTAIDGAIELIAQSVTDTRTLIFELSPPVLYDLGLKEALSWLVEEVEKRHGLRVELVDDALDKPLDETSAALVFRAVRELLMNVFKHAQSPTAKVSLRRTGDHVDIDVEDRGVGFPQEDATSGSGDSRFGLFSVREQISRLGGTVNVVSSPKQGAKVSLRVPLLSETGPASDAKGPAKS
jgi:PAS domain S-box-containing protein